MEKELSVEARHEIADAYDELIRHVAYAQLQGRIRRVVEGPHRLTPEDVAEDTAEIARVAARLHRVIHGHCVWEAED